MPKKEPKAEQQLVKKDLPVEVYEELLTDKERIYIEEILRGSTDRAAKIKAGYKSVSRKPRWVVKEIIRRRVTEMAGKNRVTTDRIFGELSHMAFSNIEDYLDGEGMPKEFFDINPEARAAIRDYMVSESGSKVVLHDKMAALTALAKLMGMEPSQRHEHTGPDGGPVEVNVNIEERKKNVLNRIKGVVDMRQGEDGVYRAEE